MGRQYERVSLNEGWTLAVWWLGSSINNNGRLSELKDLECFIVIDIGGASWENLYGIG